MLRSFIEKVGRTHVTLRRGRPAASRLRPGRSKRPRFEPLEARLLLETGPLLISEFMASNGTFLDDHGQVVPANGLLDGDGNSSDWIEIHNSAATPQSLAGYYLTDDLDDTTQWPFPDVTIGANQYLVVFASNGREDVSDPAKDPFSDPAGHLHTNFKLEADGKEDVALIMPDGETVVHAYEDFPEQLSDISYGLPDSTTIRNTLTKAILTYEHHSQSNPVPGILRAVRTFRDDSDEEKRDLLDGDRQSNAGGGSCAPG